MFSCPLRQFVIWDMHVNRAMTSVLRTEYYNFISLVDNIIDNNIIYYVYNV